MSGLIDRLESDERLDSIAVCVQHVLQTIAAWSGAVGWSAS